MGQYWLVRLRNHDELYTEDVLKLGNILNYDGSTMVFIVYNIHFLICRKVYIFILLIYKIIAIWLGILRMKGIINVSIWLMIENKNNFYINFKNYKFIWHLLTYEICNIEKLRKE